MYKCFNFNRPAVAGGIFPAKLIDFSERELSGRHDAGYTHPAQILDRLGSCDGHLSAGVQGQPGTSLAEGAQHSKILHDHTVQACPVQFTDKRGQVSELGLPGQNVGSQIYFSSENMSFFDRAHDLPVRKIVRVGAGTELFSSEIDCVRPCVNGSHKGLSAAGRRKKLNPLRMISHSILSRFYPSVFLCAAASSFIWTATSSCLRSASSCSRSSTCFCSCLISLLALK